MGCSDNGSSRAIAFLASLGSGGGILLLHAPDTPPCNPTDKVQQCIPAPQKQIPHYQNNPKQRAHKKKPGWSPHGGPFFLGCRIRFWPLPQFSGFWRGCKPENKTKFLKSSLECNGKPHVMATSATFLVTKSIGSPAGTQFGQGKVWVHTSSQSTNCRSKGRPNEERWLW